MLNRIINPLVRSVAFRGSNVKAIAPRRAASTYESDIPKVTMDDLPVPGGSWETQNKTNQAKYNMHLAAGLIFTAVTLVVAKASGMFYLNYSIPKLSKE